MISVGTAASVTDSNAIIGILILLALLILKELAGAAGGRRAERLAKALNIAIVPLLVVFALIASTKIAEVLR